MLQSLAQNELLLLGLFLGLIIGTVLGYAVGYMSGRVEAINAMRKWADHQAAVEVDPIEPIRVRMGKFSGHL